MARVRPGVGTGRVYGFRVNGPFDSTHGLRYNPAKLLLYPYVRGIVRQVRYGPEMLCGAIENPCAPSRLDSAAHVLRSVVLADMAPRLGPRGAARLCNHGGTRVPGPRREVDEPIELAVAGGNR